MSWMRNIFRRRNAPVIQNNAPILSPDVTVKCKGRVYGIACIPEHDLVGVAAWKGVFICSFETKAEPLRVFYKQEKDVSALVHLSDDVLASVDETGVLLTWRAGTCAVLDKLGVSQCACTAIPKASFTHLLVGTNKGGVVSVRH